MLSYFAIYFYSLIYRQLPSNGANSERAAHAGGSGVRLNDGPDIKLFILIGLGRSFFVCCLAHRGSTVGFLLLQWGARWLSGRVSDSGARGPGFETYLRRVVSLSKTLYSPKVLVNYPGSDGSVPT